MKITIEIRKFKNGFAPVLCKNGFIVTFDREVIANMLEVSNLRLRLITTQATEAKILAEYTASHFIDERGET